jgi:hypothetical protein
MAKTEAKPAAPAAPKAGIVQKFEAFSGRAASSIPYPRLQLWLKAYFHPQETFEEEKKKASMDSISANYIPAALFGGVTATIAIFITLFVMNSLAQNKYAEALSSFNPAFYYAFAVLAGTFFTALFYCSLHAFCKLLGGQNKLFELSYALVLVSAGTVFLNAIPSMLSGILCLGVVGLPIAIYGIYSTFLVIRHASKLSTLKTIAAMALAGIASYAAYILVIFALNLPWPYGFASQPDFPSP